MSWTPLPNTSYLRDCIQNGGQLSVTNWNCQGVEIRGNVFNDIGNECIVTETGSFTIVDNEFNSGQNDILFNNVSAGLHSYVEGNVFNGANMGYNARGTTFAQNEITNNLFQTGYLDVMNEGHNQYDLRSNDITATFGAASFYNDFGVADVHLTSFVGNVAGCLPSGINWDYNFYDNCYNTQSVDNYIQGQIGSVAGANFGPANNCFTHEGQASTGILDLGGSPDPFTCYEPDNVDPDCRNAVLAHPNVTRYPVSGPSFMPDCGSNLQGSGSGGSSMSYCWRRRGHKDQVLTAYAWIKAKLEEIDSNPNLSNEQKEWFAKIYKRCLKRVRGYLAEILLKEEKY